MSAVAFLWDESHLWGLMAYKSLRALNLPFDPIRAEDIRQGCLDRYRMLFVPGGWASNKLKALGEKGIEEIREFVRKGGNYFGICGGAGLATLDGIGLLDIKRKPTKERVPSFSGKIKLNISDHPIFNPLPLHPFTHSPIFYAWWPSQFVVHDSSINVIATFGEALPDSFSSDLNVGDIERADKWSEFEKLYGINLDPKRLTNEPAVVEGNYGKGRVILSLIHFDTHDDRNGAEILKNIWHHLAGEEAKRFIDENTILPLNSSLTNSPNNFSLQDIAFSLLREAEGLIDFGIRNLLWFWRTPMLLQWRRGIRGLEYCTLYIMIKEITEKLENHSDIHKIDNKDLNIVKELLITFSEKAKNLLILERYTMHYELITYEKCFNPEIQQMRSELFGNSKSYGGLFKYLIDKIDKILFRLLVS